MEYFNHHPRRRSKRAKTRLIPLKPSKRHSPAVSYIIGILSEESLPVTPPIPHLTQPRNISDKNLIERINIEEVLRDSYKLTEPSSSFITKLGLKLDLTRKSEPLLSDLVEERYSFKNKRLNIHKKKLNLSKCEEFRSSFSGISTTESKNSKFSLLKTPSNRLKLKTPRIKITRRKSNNKLSSS